MKAILSLVIVALIGAVGYLWTELKQVKSELKKEEPKVVINIHKNEPKVTTKSHYHDSNQSAEELQKTVKKDFQKIFKDIFGNKEVQKQVKEGMSEFKKGLNQAITELQKSVNEMDKDSGNIFGEILKELGAGEYKVFEDKGSFYELVIDIHHDKNAKVEIDAKNGLLSVKVTSHIEQKTQTQVIKKKSLKSFLVKIPSDAVMEMIKSEYKDGKIYITVPKKGKERA